MMPTFKYRARNQIGQEVEGRLVAGNEGLAVEQLRGQGLLILAIKAATGAKRDDGARGLPGFGPRSRHVELVLRQIALMRRSGLGLLAALRHAAKVTRSRSLGRILTGVAAEVEEGTSFAESLGRHPCFPPMVVALVRAGETSGTLERALERGASLMEKRRRLRGSILHALFYPAIVVTATVVVAGYLVFNVIPELEKFLLGFDRRLPPITQTLLAVTHWLGRNAVPLGVVLLTVVVSVAILDRWPPGRRRIDSLLYRLPGLRTFRRSAGTAVFSRALAILLDSGIDLLAALGLTRSLLPRPLAKEDVDRMIIEVSSGEPLAAAIERARTFSPLLPSMVSVGEETGNLDHVLDEVADHEETRIADWIARANAMIEPVLTIVIGTIVGFVYIAFFTSLFAIAGAG